MSSAKTVNPFHNDPPVVIESWVIDFFAKKLADAGMMQCLATTAANMFGRWRSQKSKPVSILDEAEMYGISPETALDIWEVIAETFELEMRRLEEGWCNFEIVEVVK